MEVVRDSNAPIKELPEDLKKEMLNVIAQVSLTQAQHITIRRAQEQLRTNKNITHSLVARLCHDTAERYREMEKQAKTLIGDATSKTPAATAKIGTYFVAHIRYKCLYFMGMAYTMMGIMRVEQNDEDGIAYGIKNLQTAVDMFERAELAAKKFVETARSMVYVDNLTILTQLDDCRSTAAKILEKAEEENNSVYYKPIPEKADALPDRMSNVKAEEFGDVPTSSMWTRSIYAAFDPSKAPPLHIGKVPPDADCCPVQ